MKNSRKISLIFLQLYLLLVILQLRKQLIMIHQLHQVAAEFLLVVGHRRAITQLKVVMIIRETQVAVQQIIQVTQLKELVALVLQLVPAMQLVIATRLETKKQMGMIV
nr:hypothetical protein [Orientia tsutsugamushi]